MGAELGGDPVVKLVMQAVYCYEQAEACLDPAANGALVRAGMQAAKRAAELYDEALALARVEDINAVARDMNVQQYTRAVADCRDKQARLHDALVVAEIRATLQRAVLALDASRVSLLADGWRVQAQAALGQLNCMLRGFGGSPS